VSAHAISALARVAGRRFQSFSEAADSVLDVLEEELPGAKIIVGELNPDDGSCRVVDARGEVFESIERGSSLRWTQEPANGNGAASGRRKGMLDPELLRALEVGSYLAIPFDTSNGTTLGTLCALGAESGLFTQDHAELLTLSGRLLNYEWESVKWRADLRRMEEQLRDPERTDKLTGLPNRPSLIAALDREWELCKRGTVTSWVLVAWMRDLDSVRASYGEAMADLVMKDVAEALRATIRRTDYVGRVGANQFGVVLVGCKGPEGAKAFFDRFQDSLAKIMRGRPVQAEVTYGAHSLAESASAEQALDLAGLASPAPARGGGSAP
jgi:diguanylate cyclase (GGDEF)-like protein